AVRGDVVGDTLFYGRGAGQDPTASAVIGDIAEAAMALDLAKCGRSFSAHKLYGKVREIGQIVSRYYLRLNVLDRPGVLAQVAAVLGRHKIGISSVIQPESEEPGESVPLVLLIHDARESDLRKALKAIESLKCIKSAPRVMHVEDFD
ncbi:MAG: ACT domain-containing protein, partial [Verrucomicrobiae bacterium]|nr:ACT domain-containing protein [Verrucomicrobiae bacterium]